MVDMWYMMPFHIAQERKHPSVSLIGLINLFLGWTIVGWLLSLAWAVMAKDPLPTHQRQKVMLGS